MCWDNSMDKEAVYIKYFGRIQCDNPFGNFSLCGRRHRRGDVQSVLGGIPVNSHGLGYFTGGGDL